MFKQVLKWTYKVFNQYRGDPVRGFRESGEWSPKQPGSQEQDAKMTKEQGAEKINLGSMEHRMCP